jgi:hypothetical protein
MIEPPTKQDVVKIAESLINGELSPLKAARWAEKFSYPENETLYETFEKQDPALTQLIDDLSMSAAINAKGELVYSTADFSDWLNEFLSKKT